MGKGSARKNSRSDIQARVAAAKKRLHLSDENPFDKIRVPSKRPTLNKQVSQTRNSISSRSSHTIDQLASAQSSQLHDERVQLGQQDKGYHQQVSRVIRAALNEQSSASFGQGTVVPPSANSQERSDKEIYREIMLRSKQAKEQKRADSTEMQGMISRIDESYKEVLPSLPPRAVAESARQPLLLEYELQEQHKIAASKGAVTQADILRAGAQRLEELERKRISGEKDSRHVVTNTLSSRKPRGIHVSAKTDLAAKNAKSGATASTDRDAENIDLCYAVDDQFIASDATSDSQGSGDYQTGDSSQDGSTDQEHDSVYSAGADEESQHLGAQLIDVKENEVNVITANVSVGLGALSFVLPVPDTYEHFISILDSVRAHEEVIVLDRLIKTNSLARDRTNGVSLELLASFCLRRMLTLCLVEGNIDMVRADSLMRALRHLSTELPRYLAGLFRTQYLSIFTSFNAVFAKFVPQGITSLTDETLESMSDLSDGEPKSATVAYNSMISCILREALPLVFVTRLVTISYPLSMLLEQGPCSSPTGLDSDLPDFSGGSASSDTLSPLYEIAFLVVEHVATTLVLLLGLQRNAQSTHVSSVAFKNNSRTFVLVHVLFSTLASLCIHSGCYSPGAVYTLESLTAVLQHRVCHAASPAPNSVLLQLSSLHADNASLSFGQYSGVLSSISYSILFLYQVWNRLPVRHIFSAVHQNMSKIHRHLRSLGAQYLPPGLEDCVSVMTRHSGTSFDTINWSPERQPEVASHDPHFMVDFQPGKTFNPDVEKQRALKAERQAKKKKRSEHRNAVREIRAKTALRQRDDVAKKGVRGKASNRMLETLYSEATAYKGLDAATRRLSGK